MDGKYIKLFHQRFPSKAEKESEITPISPFIRRNSRFCLNRVPLESITNHSTCAHLSFLDHSLSRARRCRRLVRVSLLLRFPGHCATCNSIRISIHLHFNWLRTCPYPAGINMYNNNRGRGGVDASHARAYAMIRAATWREGWREGRIEAGQLFYSLGGRETDNVSKLMRYAGR